MQKKMKKKMVDAFKDIMDGAHDEASTTDHYSISPSFFHSFSIEEEFFENGLALCWGSFMPGRAHGLRLLACFRDAWRKSIR